MYVCVRKTFVTMQTHCLEIITLHLIKFLIESKLFLLYKGLKYKKILNFSQLFQKAVGFVLLSIPLNVFVIFDCGYQFFPCINQCSKFTASKATIPINFSFKIFDEKPLQAGTFNQA